MKSKKVELIIGMRFGKLLIKKESGSNDNGDILYECECDCGNIKILPKSWLDKGIKSCGCGRTGGKVAKDLVGERFCKLTAIERIEYRSISGRSRPKYRCICDCGNETIVSSEALTSGRTRSCGCLKGVVPEDLTDQTFNYLTAIRQVENKGKKVCWECKCVCGNIIIVTASNLKGGSVKSCGCMTPMLISQKTSTHNESKTRLYAEWSRIKRRVFNVHSPDYKHYGDRGITMCEEWVNDYIVFRDWALANGYNDRLSIDRIDVNGNYEPNNCRWVNAKIQMNNMTTNVHLVFEGVSHTISEWIDLFGVRPGLVYGRRTRNWPEKRLFDPPNGRINYEDEPIYYNEVLKPIIFKEKERLEQERLSA